MTDHAPDPGEHDMTDHTDLLDTVDVHLKWLRRPNPSHASCSVDDRQSADYIERLAAALRAETGRADTLTAVARRLLNGWYPTTHSRDGTVWLKDHYPNDGFLTEPVTPAEQAALDLLTGDQP